MSIPVHRIVSLWSNFTYDMSGPLNDGLSIISELKVTSGHLGLVNRSQEDKFGECTMERLPHFYRNHLHVLIKCDNMEGHSN